MVEQFLNHIHRHSLCKTTDKILLAVSGGVDSMVMLDLFVKAGFTVGVAHCNFSLRGEESDGDENFVDTVCSRLKIPFYNRKFDTLEVAALSKKSIQTTARELRYEFFENIASSNGYAFVATAHHLDDSLETILINLTRGTGLTGLQGVPVKKGRIIRPMLFTNREEIVHYAKASSVSWREDSSNSKEDYQRNFLRHQVIPKLRELNPNLPVTMGSTIERIAGGLEIFSVGLRKLQEELCIIDHDLMKIDRHKLLAYSESAALLWELIKGYGFNYEQCKDMVQTQQPGKQFFSNNVRLNIDRQFLLIDIHNPRSETDIFISSDDREAVRGDRILTLEYRDGLNYNLFRESAIAEIDADLVQFPLVWREIRAGDSMTPLGMRNRKKISDMLVDSKVPVIQKNKLTVVTSNDEVIWLEGIRISDNFKVNSKTKRVLVLRIAPKG